jgi:polar amino acid transport system substrate-binding protein
LLIEFASQAHAHPDIRSRPILEPQPCRPSTSTEFWKLYQEDIESRGIDTTNPAWPDIALFFDGRMKMNIQRNARWALASFLMGMVVSGAAAAGDIPVTAKVKADGKLSIANSLAYPPFDVVDEAGQPAGLDIELASAAAKLMGVKLDVVRMPFASQIPGLAAGRITVAWTTFTITPERLQQVDFVSYLQAGTVVAAKPANKDKFKTETDICGKKIAVQTGSSGDFIADKISAICKSKSLPAIDKMIVPEAKDSIQAVLTGHAEGWMDDSTVCGYFETTSHGAMVIASPSYFPAPLGIAVHKGNTETANMMHAAVQELIANGTYASLVGKYNMQASAVKESVVYTKAEQLQ